MLSPTKLQPADSAHPPLSQPHPELTRIQTYNCRWGETLPRPHGQTPSLPARPCSLQVFPAPCSAPTRAQRFLEFSPELSPGFPHTDGQRGEAAAGCEGSRCPQGEAEAAAEGGSRE